MADDLNRWLRRVRPPTSADGDDWADSDEALQSLSDIHRRVSRVHAQRRARLWTLLPTAAVGAAAAAVLVATSFSSPDAPTHNARIPTLTNLRPAAMLLTPFASCGGLLSDLRTHALAHVDQFGSGRYYSTPLNGPGVRAPALIPEPTMAGAALRAGDTVDQASAGSSTTSTTNVQEVGVDEPDIVKTDGEWVVTVTDGRLRVLDAASRTQLGSLDLRPYNGSQSAQLLVAGDKAIVLLTGLNSGVYRTPLRAGGLAQGGPAIIDGPGVANPIAITSTLLYVDLFGSPRVTGSLTVDGSIVDARMVGTTVRLVTSSSPNIQPDLSNARTTASYNKAVRSAITSAPLTKWLPSYSVSSSGQTRNVTVPCASVSHPADYSAASMLTIYTVDPTKPDADPQPVSLTADGNTVYATQSSLYVASSPDCGWCFGFSGQTSTTDIHRFDIAGTGKPTYLGSGTVKGSLLSQYSLSDYNGSLRVATTTRTNSGPAVSGVDVLDLATLKQTGAVGGLGKGEVVYAVRFLGPLGYVVTYNQQDPLYVLDLSDPDAPRQVGALEIPGFSSYLHDVGGGRLLGVGQDTKLVNEGGGLYAHNEGRMVQLFDVSNPSKPTRTAKVVVPNSGTPGDPSFDPHAFLFWPDTGLVVVPIANYGNGGVLAVRLDGKNLVEVGTAKNPGDEQTGQIERSMIVDGNLWTFSQSGVRVSAQSNLAQLGWIPFG